MYFLIKYLIYNHIFINKNKMADSKISVLFVCLGNICRSPMAEAVFTAEVVKRNLRDKFTIDSCGTCSYHVGESPDSRSSRTCKKHNVPVNHRARQVDIEYLNKYKNIIINNEILFKMYCFPLFLN